MVTVRLFAALRELVGQREVHLPGDGASIKQLVSDFAEKYGESARRALFDKEGRIWESVVLVLNDEVLDRKSDVHVAAGDVVSILLPTAGG